MEANMNYNSVICQILACKIVKKEHLLIQEHIEPTMLMVDQLIQYVLNSLIRYSNKSLKRLKYHRINIQAIYTISHIYFHIVGNRETAFQHISEVCQP
jgi:hypothetical protein